MISKKIFMGAAIGTAGLVALTGATFADTSDQSTTHGSGIKDRVAEILGIAPETLQSAIQQAREEHQDEVLAERLAQAVEDGKITREEADAILSWIEAKPEMLDGLRGFGKRADIGMLIGAAMSPERMSAKLDRLVEAGVVSEADAQEIKNWIARAPVEALEKLGPKEGDRPGHERHEDGDEGEGRRHGRGFSGRMFGEGPGGRLFEGRFHIRPYAPQAPSDDTVTYTAASVVAGDPV